MFGKKDVITLANPRDEKPEPSKTRDMALLLGICFGFGVLLWYLIRPVLGL